MKYAVEVIKQIAQASGNDKIAILKTNAMDENLRFILEKAMCPFTTYGVKKYPRFENGCGTKEFDDQTKSLLDALSSRELTGGAALAAIEEELKWLEPFSQEALRMILDKDVKAGIAPKSVNKAIPGLITVFECMLSHKYEPKRVTEWPVMVQPKYDGVRALFIKKGDSTGFYSRTGKRFEAADGLAEMIGARLGNFPSVVLDGELIDQSNSFNKIVGDVHKKDNTLSSAIFMAFDILGLIDFNKGECSTPYKWRYEPLRALAERYFRAGDPIAVAPTMYAENDEQVREIYQTLRDRGGEGVIVKNTQAPYVCKRSYDWLKIKDEQSIDVPMVGWERGTGKFANTLGAIIVSVGGKMVNVGSGLTDDMRAEIWDKRHELMEDQPLVEVEYHEMTPDGSLRHPRFVRFRTDKPAADGAGA